MSASVGDVTLGHAVWSQIGIMPFKQAHELPHWRGDDTIISEPSE